MKTLDFIIVLIGGIICFGLVAHAAVNIDKIVVDFDRNVATVQSTQGYYDNNNVFQSLNASTTTIIRDPSFSQTINELEQANALDLNAVISVLTNTQ